MSLLKKLLGTTDAMAEARKVCPCVRGLSPARLERHVPGGRADGQRGYPAYGRAWARSVVVGELDRRRHPSPQGARNDGHGLEGEPRRTAEARGRGRPLCGGRVLR